MGGITLDFASEWPPEDPNSHPLLTRLTRCLDRLRPLSCLPSTTGAAPPASAPVPIVHMNLEKRSKNKALLLQRVTQMLWFDLIKAEWLIKIAFKLGVFEKIIKYWENKIQENF